MEGFFGFTVFVRAAVIELNPSLHMIAKDTETSRFQSPSFPSKTFGGYRSRAVPSLRNEKQIACARCANLTFLVVPL